MFRLVNAYNNQNILYSFNFGKDTTLFIKDLSSVILFAGRETVKVVPFPTVDSTKILP